MSLLYVSHRGSDSRGTVQWPTRSQDREEPGAGLLHSSALSTWYSPAGFFRFFFFKKIYPSVFCYEIFVLTVKSIINRKYISPVFN